MKKHFISILGLLITLVLFSCSKSVEQQSEKFFKHLNKENYDKIKSMSIVNFKESNADMAKQFYSEHGKIEEYELYNSYETPYIVESRVYDDQNRTITQYKCQTSEDTEVYVKLDFIHAGNDPDAGLFLTDMVYSTEKEYIDNYDENYQLALSTAIEYYECFESGNGDNLESLLHVSITENDNNLMNYIGLLSNRVEEFGDISNSYLISSSSELIDGNTVVSFIFTCNCSQGKCHEKISLTKQDNEFKVFNYKFANNIDDLK